MNEGLITNRLCYLFLGLLIGIGLGFYLSPTPQQSNINMKLEIQKDTGPLTRGDRHDRITFFQVFRIRRCERI